MEGGSTGTLEAVVTVLAKEDVSAVGSASLRGASTVVVSPTPAENVVVVSATLEGSLSRAGSVEVTLVDERGRIALATHVAVDGGLLRASLDVSSIAAGAYVCRITGADGSTITGRVLVRR